MLDLGFQVLVMGVQSMHLHSVSIVCGFYTPVL